MKPCNIFQLQRLSVNDGEGIRTTVFFKGCHLRCRWCANPESWRFEAQLMYLPHKCCHCGRCADICPAKANTLSKDGALYFNSALCRLCGRCITACPMQARQQLGEQLSVQEVINEIKKDYLFYMESGGGVTFSGGEPYLHPQYLRELADCCHRLGINTCTESCGYFDFEQCKDIIAAMDALFFDIKLMDSAKHKHYTGQPNAVILSNISKAAKINSHITIRVPVIKDVNDDLQNMQLLCQFLTQNTNIKHIELLTYHKLGVEKMTALGLPAQVFQPPEEHRLTKLKEIITSYGLTNISYK